MGNDDIQSPVLFDDCQIIEKIVQVYPPVRDAPAERVPSI